MDILQLVIVEYFHVCRCKIQIQVYRHVLEQKLQHEAVRIVKWFGQLVLHIAHGIRITTEKYFGNDVHGEAKEQFLHVDWRWSLRVAAISRQNVDHYTRFLCTSGVHKWF